MEARDINGNAKKAVKYARQSLRNGEVVLALDLDYTLAHYKDGLTGLFAITRKLGIVDNVAKQVLMATEERNFSFRLFYQILSLKEYVFVSEEEFLTLVAPWFKENYVLYEDAYEFLAQYLEHVPIVIVTAGDEEFQREKIGVLGFFPNEIVVVPMGASKIDALKDTHRRYQKLVVFVDDNPSEHDHISLDGWFGFPATCYHVRMVRADSPYRGIVKDLSRRPINSFEELTELSQPRKGVV